MDVTKSLRLNTALSMVPEGLTPVYDLFCDHGKLGEIFLGKRPVFFNDQLGDLLDMIKARTHCGDEALLYGPAQNLSFKPESTIFMLGVGGYQMINCFQSWFKADEKNLLENQTFIVSPHYHLIELGGFLKNFSVQCLQREFVWDGGRGYEIFALRFSKTEDFTFEVFDKTFWDKLILSHSKALFYLRHRLKFTDSYQGPEPEMHSYRETLRGYLKNYLS